MNELIVLIPHYNSVIELELTISSIKEDFAIDLLIVDDGSRIKPDFEKLRKAYENSGELILEYLPQNQGIEKALNYGLTKIQKLQNYKYIGRLDAGDCVVKDKFKKQLEFFYLNLDVSLLGTWANVVDEEFNHISYLKHPTDYDMIKKKMYLNNCFIHPSVVFRTEVLNTVGFYPENRKYAEDYAFFFQILKKYKVGNLPEFLIDYVVTGSSISTTKRKQQIKNRMEVIKDNFYLGFYPIVGLIRSAVLYFTPRNFIVQIKRKLKIEN